MLRIRSVLLGLTLACSLANPLGAVAATQIDESFGSSAGLANPTDWIAAVGATTCLTAYTGTTPVPTAGSALPGCGGTPDADGTGALRLTSATIFESGSILYSNAIPAADGIGVRFIMAMYGGSDPAADGLSFFIKNGDNPSNALGLPGGHLGYTGMPGAILAIGFDAFGNFSAPGVTGYLCTDGTPGTAFTANSIVLKSGDTSVAQDGSSGFCYLAGLPGVTFSGADRTAAAKEVLVTIDPATDAAPMVKVYVGPVGELPTTPTFTAAAPAEYAAANTFKFGLAAGTGSLTNVHEVWGLRVGEKSAVQSFLAGPELPPTNRIDSMLAITLVILAGLTAAAGIRLSFWRGERV